jgi:hypothetical protein
MFTCPATGIMNNKVDDILPHLGFGMTILSIGIIGVDIRAPDMFTPANHKS